LKVFAKLYQIVYNYISGSAYGVNHLFASVGIKCTHPIGPQMDNRFNKRCLHHLHNSGNYFCNLKFKRRI